MLHVFHMENNFWIWDPDLFFNREIISSPITVIQKEKEYRSILSLGLSFLRVYTELCVA
jgi:hypothetical protein